MSEFGRIVRSARKKLGMTMGDLARELGFSVSYVSDVERGLRAPWTDKKVLQLAMLLEYPPVALMSAAAKERGAFELDANVSDSGRSVGAYLAREWSEMTDKDFTELSNWLTKRQRDRET